MADYDTLKAMMGPPPDVSDPAVSDPDTDHYNQLKAMMSGVDSGAGGVPVLGGASADTSGGDLASTAAIGNAGQINAPQMRAAAPGEEIPQWSDLPGNIGPSAVQTGKNLAQPFLHPVDTAKGIFGVLTDKNKAHAVGQFYIDRYGSIDNLKNTLIRDPVGAVADAALALTGSAGIIGKVGTVGKAAALAGRVGDVVDPIANAGKLAANTVEGAGTFAKAPIAAVGIPTAVGPTTTLKAFDSGLKGQSAFLDNINKKVPQEAVLDDLQTGIKRMQEEASAQYQADTTLPARQVDMTPIVKSWQDFRDSKTAPNGEWFGSDADKTATDNMWTDIDKFGGSTSGNADWLDLDKLKQRLRTQYYGQSPDIDRGVTEITNAVKGAITNVVPEYQTAMGNYSDAMGTLADVRKTLSQNKTAAVDTQLAKLRNSMSGTSRGDRAASVVDKVEQASGQPINAALAGQRMSGWMPLKDHPVVQRALGAVGAYGGITNPAAAAAMIKALPYLAITSPRLMGNALYGAGAAGRYAGVPFNAAARYAGAPFRAAAPYLNVPSSGDAARAIARSGMQVGRPLLATDDDDTQP